MSPLSADTTETCRAGDDPDTYLFPYSTFPAEPQLTDSTAADAISGRLLGVCTVLLTSGVVVGIFFCLGERLPFPTLPFPSSPSRKKALRGNRPPPLQICFSVFSLFDYEIVWFASTDVFQSTASSYHGNGRRIA